VKRWFSAWMASLWQLSVNIRSALLKAEQAAVFLQKRFSATVRNINKKINKRDEE